jgi:hypothetical protein
MFDLSTDILHKGMTQLTLFYYSTEMGFSLLASQHSQTADDCLYPVTTVFTHGHIAG